jgi:L-ascorbate metabolism protein UlaG (beta-lactamase superfamily)
MDLGSAELTWLGHSAIRLRLADGTTALIDPWLTGNPSCPEAEKHQARVDSIYLTHGHFDHFGDTLELAEAHDPMVFAIHEVAVYLGSKGVEHAVGLNKGGTVSGPGGIEGTMVTAVHSAGISEDDRIVAGGEAAGWVLDLPDGPTLYHAGDTALFGDLALIAEAHHPDVACLPIGGHYTMGPEEAATAARMLGVSAVIPVHWGTFPILAGTPQRLAAALEGSNIEVVEAAIGQPLSQAPGRT